jgi:hypothetical protein
VTHAKAIFEKGVGVGELAQSRHIYLFMIKFFLTSPDLDNRFQQVIKLGQEY